MYCRRMGITDVRNMADFIRPRFWLSLSPYFLWVFRLCRVYGERLISQLRYGYGRYDFVYRTIRAKDAYSPARNGVVPNRAPDKLRSVILIVIRPFLSGRERQWEGFARLRRSPTLNFNAKRRFSKDFPICVKIASSLGRPAWPN